MLLDNRKAGIEDEAASVLRDAADVIDHFGWCRGEARDADGRFCLLGAIKASARHRGRSVLKAARRLKRYTGGEDITDHNDLTLTSKEEAVWLLRKAAQ
jgi:hypothetical protein